MSSHYIYILRPIRPDFISNFTPNEEAIMNEHFHYLKGLLKEGRLVIAGPSEEGGFGVVIFSAESRVEAENIAASDPAVKKGLMTAEVFDYRVSLLKERD